MNETIPDDSTLTVVDKKWAVGSLTYTRGGMFTTFFWLLLGAFAWSLKDRAGQPIIQLLLSSFGANDTFSSFLIFSIPAAMAIGVLPILGYFSDRYRSPWGRRIPFLAMMVPFVVISMVGIAVSPWLGRCIDRVMGPNPSGSNARVVLCLAVFWALFEFAYILGNLMFGALINDVVPRRFIGRFFGCFRAVGLIAGMIFNYYLFDKASIEYVPILLGIAVFVFVAFGFMCMKVREGSYSSAPPDPKGGAEIMREAGIYIRNCFGSSFYWLLFVAWALGSTAWTPVNLYSVLFSTEFVTPAHYGNLLATTFAVSFVIAYPLGILADRFHPLRLAIATLVLYAIAALWGGLYATTAQCFDIAFVLHGVLSGAYMTATASLLQRMFPRSKFAQLASAAGVVVCLVNILISPFAGFVLKVVDRDYRFMFLLSSAQADLGLIATLLLYSAFKARGGVNDYVAPGEKSVTA